MKIKFTLSFILALTLCNTAIANRPPKPERCPDAAALSSGGFDSIKGHSGDGWGAIKRDSTYGTKEHWTFIMQVGAATQKEALEKATRFASRVQFKEPKYLEKGSSWMCDASEIFPDKDVVYIAAAITPPHDFPDSLLKITNISK